MIDSHSLQKGEDFSSLPETYIIFITEHDIYKENKAIYTVNQTISVGNKTLSYNDGTHKIFVNGSYVGNDAIGWLMHDFRESDAEKMHYAEIAERVRFHKQEEEEVNTVCRAFEEYGKEKANEKAISMAKKLIKENVLSLEKIAEIAELPLAQVQQMAQEVQ